MSLNKKQVYEIYWAALRGETIEADLFPLIMERARHEGVLPYLAFLHPDIPQRAEIRRSSMAEHLFRVRLVGAVKSALDSAKIPWVILKGLAVATKYYVEPWSRPSGDCDILVRKEDKITAISALKQIGFYSTPHHRELLISDFGEVDIHSGFLNAERITARRTVFERTPDWDRRVKYIESDVGQLPVLDDRDEAIYLTLHLTHHHGLSGARWIIDLAKAIKKNSGIVEDILSLGKSGVLTLNVIKFLFELDLSLESFPMSRFDRIVMESAYEGLDVPGIRFILSCREIGDWKERISFMRQAIIPDKNVLNSAAYSTKKRPFYFHVERILKTGLGLCRLYWKSIGGFEN